MTGQDLERIEAFSRVTEALSKLSRRHGTLVVREIARGWVELMDRAEAAAQRMETPDA